MDFKNETYIGDGLYASFDGYQLYLRAPRIDGDHWVALDNEVFNNLIAFLEKTKTLKMKPPEGRDDGDQETA